MSIFIAFFLYKKNKEIQEKVNLLCQKERDEGEWKSNELKLLLRVSITHFFSTYNASIKEKNRRDH